MNDFEIREAYKEDTVGRKIPSSIVTKKEIVSSKGKSSECITTRFDKPMTKKEFKFLSKETKIAYINHLQNTYGVLRRDIATMLGYDENAFSNICRKQLHMGSARGGKKEELSGYALERWQRFCNGECIETDPEINVEEKLQTETPMPLPLAILEDTKAIEPKKRMGTTKFSIEQKGELNMGDLARFISFAFPKGTKCRINISIEALEEGETA